MVERAQQGLQISRDRASVPTIVIAGMPGVGKTTLSNHIVENLSISWEPIEISIDDALGVQCPEGESSFLHETLYVRDGSRFILNDDWRPEQMKLATSGVFVLSRFAQRVTDIRELPHLLLLEFPTSAVPSMVELAQRERMTNCIFVFLNASIEVCRMRNELRSPDRRVPPAAMSYFERATETIDIRSQLQQLRDLGWYIVEQDTAGPLNETRRSIDLKIQEAVTCMFV